MELVGLTPGKNTCCRYAFFPVLATALLSVTLATSAYGQAPVAGELLVTPVRVKAPDDFSSTYRGYWWDFTSETHFSVEGTLRGWAQSGLSGGWWIGTSIPSKSDPNHSDGYVLLNNLYIDGPQPTNWEPSEQRYRPFDPAYHHLTLRMCSNSSSKMFVRWHRNLSFADRDYGGTSFQNVEAGCKFYSFDLNNDRNPGVGTFAWSQGGFYSIAVLPVNEPGIEVMIDYATLSPQPAGVAVTVSWTQADEPVELSVSNTPDGTHATSVADGLTGGSYQWRTPNLAPGDYFLIGETASGRHLTVPVLTVDAPPRGVLLAPSYTSGPDYATTVVKNRWDMSNSTDISLALGSTGKSFSGGVFQATSLAKNPTGDPVVFLRVTTPINTKRYRYLTYRMWVSGDGVLQGTGGVARVFWYNNRSLLPGTFSFTQDVRVYKGWRTVSIDLAKAYLERNSSIGAWGSFPVTNLRIDPHESPAPRSFKIDWVKLTGDVIVRTSYRIRYTAEDPDGGTPAVQLYYSTSRDPGTGAVLITCQPDPLPLSCVWNVPPTLPIGSYFVHMRLADAAGNRTWVTSDIPLLRR